MIYKEKGKNEHGKRDTKIEYNRESVEKKERKNYVNDKKREANVGLKIVS